MNFDEVKERLNLSGDRAEESNWHPHSNGGGWVENCCFVKDFAFVGLGAIVHGKGTQVGDGAKVYGEGTEIRNGARVTGEGTEISDGAWVDGEETVVSDGAWVSGKGTVVRDGAHVSGKGTAVRDGTWIDGDGVRVLGKATAQAISGGPEDSRPMKARPEEKKPITT